MIKKQKIKLKDYIFDRSGYVKVNFSVRRCSNCGLLYIKEKKYDKCNRFHRDNKG